MQKIQRFFAGWTTTFQQQGCVGKVLLVMFSLLFLCLVCGVPIVILSPSSPTPEIAKSTPMDVSSVQTMAVETVIAGINQTAAASAPTNTPKPILPTETPIPTETILPTAILSPEEALLQLSKDHFKDDLIDAKISDVFGKKYATIDYDLGDQWDETTAISSSNLMFITFSPRVFKIEGIDVVELRSFTTFTDAYGNAKQDVAMKYTLTRELSKKINWGGILWSSVGITLNLEGDGSGVYVHPALQAAWLEYISK
jgi:hypothetical protein